MALLQKGYQDHKWPDTQPHGATRTTQNVGCQWRSPILDHLVCYFYHSRYFGTLTGAERRGSSRWLHIADAKPPVVSTWHITIITSADLCGMKAVKLTEAFHHIPTQHVLACAAPQQHDGPYTLGPVTTGKVQPFRTCFDVKLGCLRRPPR